MTASMTIQLTEDDDPNGHVTVNFAIKGFDVASAETNADLPPAVKLGARMIKLSEDLEDLN